MRLLWSSLLAVLFLLLAAAAVLYVLFAVMFWEPDRAKPGSVAYLLAIPAIAKNFPILNPCDVPTYSYRFHDGLSPETYWIDYETRLPLAELKSAFERLAASRKCEPISQSSTGDTQPDTQTMIVCRTGSRVMRVTAAGPHVETGKCRPITVLFTEDLWRRPPRSQFKKSSVTRRQADSIRVEGNVHKEPSADIVAGY